MKSQHKEKIAIVLFNLGGPSSLESVSPFLFNIFNDPYIIDLPFPLRYFLAKIISYFRLKKAVHTYSLLGGKSPLLDNTYSQAQMLQDIFDREQGKGLFKVFVSMRYWHPFFLDVLPNILSFSPSRIVFLPLYPQFSSTTTLSFYAHAKKVLSKKKCSLPTQLICCYPILPGFIEAMVQSIQKSDKLFLPKPTKFRLLLTAHGLPLSIVKKGDPYSFQLDLTKKALEEKLKNFSLESIVLCYQSKVGFLPWLSPSVEQELHRAAKDKVSVAVLPISFVSEHSETLVELDKDYLDLSKKLGIPFYLRFPTVSCNLSYLDSLCQLVISSLKSSKEIVSSTGLRLCSKESKFCPCSY